MATANQINWMRNVEERRHNIANERENARHNIRSEAINMYDIITKAASEKYKADSSLYGSMYSADKHFAGTTYAADTNYRGTIYSAQSHLAGTKYAADSSRASSMYAADKNYAASIYSADKNYEGTVYSANRSYDSTVLVNTGRIEAAQIAAQASRYSADLNYAAKNTATLSDYSIKKYTADKQYQVGMRNAIANMSDALIGAIESRELLTSKKFKNWADVYESTAAGGKSTASAMNTAIGTVKDLGGITASALGSVFSFI